MTTTATHTRTGSSTTTTARSLWAAGSLAALVAAGATTTIAAAGHAAGVSLDIDDQPIPLLGFAQLTAVFALIGVGIAHLLARRAASPRSTFVKVTVGLTVLSLVPDVVVNAATETKALLMLTHLVAAAIVIPVVARRLSD